MATEKLKFKLELYATMWNKPPIADISIDSKNYFKEEITGTKDKPTPISKQEVQGILDRMEKSVDKPKMKTIFEVGEVVRITEGPFADFTG